MWNETTPLRSRDAQTRYVTVNGLTLAYRTFGTGGGTPLLLTMRLRGTMDHWDPAFVDALAAERPVVVFDSAGVGRSDGAAPSSITGMAELAGAFVDALGLPQVDVLGWSMGGAVALQLAILRPDLVRRLVFAGSGPGGVPDAPRTPPEVFQVAARPVNTDDDFLYLFFTDSEASRAAGLASLRRIDRRVRAADHVPVGPATLAAQLGALAAWGRGEGSAYAHLDRVRTPTLVLNGTNDIMVPAYSSYVMSQRMPNAQLVLYPDAGHGFLFQYPEQVAGDVLRFLR